MWSYPRISRPRSPLILSSKMNIRGPILCHHLWDPIRLWLCIALYSGPIYRCSDLVEIQLFFSLCLLPLRVIAGSFRSLPFFKAHLEMGSSLLIFDCLRYNIGIIRLYPVVEAWGGPILGWASSKVKVGGSQLGLDGHLGWGFILGWLRMLVLHVLLCAILIQMAFCTDCNVRFFYRKALSLGNRSSARTTHISLINGHDWFLCNDNIIEIEISLLHLLFLLLQILSTFMRNFMLDMWALRIRLIISRNVSLPKIKMRFPDFFDLLFNLFLVFGPDPIWISLVYRFSCLLV